MPEPGWACPAPTVNAFPVGGDHFFRSIRHDMGSLCNLCGASSAPLSNAPARSRRMRASGYHPPTSAGTGHGDATSYPDVGKTDAGAIRLCIQTLITTPAHPCLPAGIFLPQN